MQNQRLELTGLAKPGKSHGLTGTRLGLAGQKAGGQVSGVVWDRSDPFLGSKPGPIAITTHSSRWIDTSLFPLSGLTLLYFIPLSAAWTGSSWIPTSTAWHRLLLVYCLPQSLPLPRFFAVLHYDRTSQSQLVNCCPDWHSCMSFCTPASHFPGFSTSRCTAISLSSLRNLEFGLFLVILHSSNTFCVLFFSIQPLPSGTSLFLVLLPFCIQLYHIAF